MQEREFLKQAGVAQPIRHFGRGVGRKSANYRSTKYFDGGQPIPGDMLDDAAIAFGNSAGKLSENTRHVGYHN